jgi:rhamnopyranosyl-N-acetylglucosaminyl-diphospho-decaprenol beta-1,3/1,4-galactofuranosyltransferase
MRVLAHIHTLNEADVIERSVAALERQTRRPDALIIVDNGSTDGTLDRPFPEWATIIRNPQNVGVSGSIGNGITYALERDFDWIWILDADSVADPEALATMLDEYAGWPSGRQEETAFIACLPLDQPENYPRHGCLFTPYGRVVITPSLDQLCYQCHLTIWSGVLYRLAAVRRIGLPNPDYFLDRGELEYGYRIMKAGYKGFMHQNAFIRHNIRGDRMPKRLQNGPITLNFFEHPPLRCYYICRNTLYFTIYNVAEGPLAKLRQLFLLRSMPGRSAPSGIAWQTALFTLNFALRPRRHGPQIRACLQGIWHGLIGNIAARY